MPSCSRRALSSFFPGERRGAQPCASWAPGGVASPLPVVVELFLAEVVFHLAIPDQEFPALQVGVPHEDVAIATDQLFGLQQAGAQGYGAAGGDGIEIGRASCRERV